MLRDEELYSVYAPIEAHPNYGVNIKGDVINLKTKRILKPYKNGNGLLKVTLDGEKCYVHKIVAEVYRNNSENKKYVLHLDHNPANNHYRNLKWSDNYIYDRSKNSP